MDEPCRTLQDFWTIMFFFQGKLLRSFTQNIDGLELVSGLPADKLIAAHGSFHTSHCVNEKCHQTHELEWIKTKIFADEVPHCTKEVKLLVLFIFLGTMS